MWTPYLWWHICGLFSSRYDQLHLWMQASTLSLEGGPSYPYLQKRRQDGSSELPRNHCYHCITVTTVILKVIEHILNRRHSAILNRSQSSLQKGFTAGHSSIDAALILSECTAEAKNSHKPLIVAMLDAQKAFDVVDHDWLLRRLYLDGITGADWLLLRNQYSDLNSSIVKWEGTLSNPLVIKQGVRQGGVLSMAHYKRYNNPLLIQLENKFIGAKIGYINIPMSLWQTTSLWWVTLPLRCTWCYLPPAASLTEQDLWFIQQRVVSWPTGTNILSNKKSYIPWTLSQVQHTNHLGIHRDSNNKVNVAEKVALGRRTAYSLMGAGLHSGNGLKQCVCGKLWSTYVVPCLIYGLEVLDMKGNDIKVLEQYQRKSLKQIQSLPDKTQNSAVLALLGILPLECIIHKNMLNLFGRWIMTDGTEKDIAVHQLATKSPSEFSWFNKIKQLLTLYGLPLPSQLLENVPTRNKWKNMVNTANNSVVEAQWREDISSKPSLRYINPESVKVGKAHHIWSSVRNNIHDSRRAQLHCRILTSTYTLQSNRAVFNQFAVDPTCKLCEKESSSKATLHSGMSNITTCTSELLCGDPGYCGLHPCWHIPPPPPPRWCDSTDSRF